MLINSATELLNLYLGNYGVIKSPAVDLVTKGKVAVCSDVTKMMREEAKLVVRSRNGDFHCLGFFPYGKMKSPSDHLELNLTLLTYLSINKVIRKSGSWTKSQNGVPRQATVSPGGLLERQIQTN